MEEPAIAERERPSCILLDTNIWVYETRLLRTAIGAAIAHAVLQMDARIGMPEVLELEIVKQTQKLGNASLDKIKSGFDVVAMLTGRRDEYRVPTAEDFARAAEQAIERFTNRVVRVAFSEAHARGALHRIMDETPPNGEKNQQFKDSAIWEAAIELAANHRVYFVTNDKAFFEARDPARGMAATLQREVAEHEHSISIHFGATGFLDSIAQQVPPINEASAQAAIVEAISEELSDHVARKNVMIQAPTDFSRTLYLTEQPGSLAVRFSIRYPARIVEAGVESSNAVVQVEGNALLDLASYTVTQGRLSEIGVMLEDGTRVPHLGVRYVGLEPVVLGRRYVDYTLRAPLEP